MDKDEILMVLQGAYQSCMVGRLSLIMYCWIFYFPNRQKKAACDWCRQPEFWLFTKVL